MTSLKVFREHDFRWFFTGQATSMLGDGMASTALAFAVLGLTGSPGDLGLVLAARVIPLILFMLAGGVLADRLPRRTVMLGADLVRFASQGTVGLLLVTGNADIASIIVLQVANGTATAVFMPAVNGLIQSTVPSDLWHEANATRGLAQSVATVGGPVLSGSLVLGFGAGWAVIVDAATFLVSAFCLARVPRDNRAVPTRSMARDLLDGWTAFRSRRWVWTVIVAAAFINMMFASFSVLGPAISTGSFGGVRGWSVILAAYGAGSTAGGLVALWVRPKNPLLFGLPVFALFATPLLALALRGSLLLVVAAAFVGGSAVVVFNALWDTTLQRHVPGEVLSRVTSFEWFGSYAGQPIGFAVCAPVAAHLGIATTLWVAGIAQMLITLAPLLVRDVRALPAGLPAPVPEKELVDQ